MNTFAKTVIINRAVPGSGKTTISKCLNAALTDKHLSIGQHSTDDFFMRGNRYCFDIKRLHSYHQRNQRDFEADLQAGKDVVICDNTNLMPWQAEPYSRMARQHGYRVIVLNFLPRELWKHVQSQIVTAEKPDAHEVPEARLVEFIEDFNNYNDLLDPSAPVDPARHRDYDWDSTHFVPVDTGKAASHFDRDAVLTIRPDEYQRAKQEIGSMVLQCMKQ